MFLFHSSVLMQIHVKNFAHIIESKRKDFKLQAKKHHICSLHFYESDMKKNFEDLLINGQVYKLDPQEKPYLKDDAIPRIFPNCPSHMTKTQKKRNYFT